MVAMTRWGGCALVLVGALIGGCVTARDSARTSENRGHEALESGDPRAAIEHFTQASARLRASPSYRVDANHLQDDARMHAQIAAAHVALRDPAAASRHYEESVTVWPDVATFDRLVATYRAAGERDRAEQAERRRQAYRLVSEKVEAAFIEITRYEGDRYLAAAAQVSRQAARVYRQMGYERLAGYHEHQAESTPESARSLSPPPVAAIAAIAVPPAVTPSPRTAPAPARAAPPPPARPAPKAEKPTADGPRAEEPTHEAPKADESTASVPPEPGTARTCPAERRRVRPGVVSVVLYAAARPERVGAPASADIRLTLLGPAGTLAICRGRKAGPIVEKSVKAPFVEAYCDAPASLSVQLCTTSSQSATEECRHPAPPGTYRIVAESLPGSPGARPARWTVRACSGEYGTGGDPPKRKHGQVGPSPPRTTNTTQELRKPARPETYCAGSRSSGGR